MLYNPQATFDSVCQSITICPYECTDMEIENHQPRKHPRHKLANTFVVNTRGVCRVFDLSLGGVSFGCTGELKIPENWTVDIRNDNGVHLPDISVKTVWTAKNNDMNTAAIYEIVVGAQFNTDLSPEEQSTLDQLFLVS